MNYIFSSERLHFRGWEIEDLKELASVNADAQVMQYFPRTQTTEDTEKFIQRMQTELEQENHCYFAAVEKKSETVIGFIGMSRQDYVPNHKAFVDIGWRLGTDHWGKGYATEGAKANLNYGFNTLGLEEIYAVAPKINTPSIHVMRKIGMELKNEFLHPKLDAYKNIERCVLYSINKTTFAKTKK